MSMVGVMADAYTAPTGGAWTPASLTGLQLWLDADDASTFTYSSGVVVSQWNDKSGNGRHITQATGTKQPSRSGTINGKSSVVFDGGDALTVTMPALTKPVTMLAVARNTTTASQRDVICATSDGRIMMQVTSGYIATYQGSFLTTGVPWGTTAVHSVALVLNGASSKIAIDSAAYTTGNAGANAFVSGQLAVGAVNTANSEYWIGDIAELVVHTGEIAPADLTAWWSYATTKWGIGAFTPTQIAGLQVWFDASDAASITSSGGAVSQWNDKSGNARHATQATGANQPITGTRTMNGQNVLDFSATDVMATASITLAQPYTVFAAVQYDNVDTAAHQIMGTSNASIVLRTNAGGWGFSAGSNVALGTDDGLPHVFAAVYNSPSSEAYIDGVVKATGATTGTGGWSAVPFYISHGSTSWDGMLAEIIVYNTVLSTTDRQAVEAYLKTKWGTT